MRHTCHAHECPRAVPPSMFMCRAHWFSLPKPLRDAVWRTYRPGQEDDKQPSASYMAVQRLAVGRSAFKANDEAAALVVANCLADAMRWQKIAIAAGAPDPLDGLLFDGVLPEETE